MANNIMMPQVNAVTSDIGKYLNETGNPWKDIQDINTLVPGLLGAALTIAFAVFVFLLIFAGIQWITAGGDKGKVESAQKKLTGAIIGIVIVISAWAILSLVKNFFNLNSSGSGSGSTSDSSCLSICQKTSCQGYSSFCYQDCRCVCNASGEMWYYENPWCDADGKTYECKNSQKTKVSDTCN
jgi:amino acid transporter